MTGDSESIKKLINLSAGKIQSRGSKSDIGGNEGVSRSECRNRHVGH